MKLVQFRSEGGDVRAGIVRGAEVEPLSVPVLSLVRMARRARLDLAQFVKSCRPSGDRVPLAALEQGGRLLAPILAEEVWGAGVTYRPSADFRDADMEAGSGIYDRAHRAERPELFFKATASRSVGSGEPIGLRADATLTAPEPELAVVVASDGHVLGYTLGNDVSAWSIERENPLYLPQSKIYDGCCALGPALVTADEVRDPRSLEIRCRVLRAGAVRFEGVVSVSQMKRTVGELVGWLLRSNSVPDGTVLLTGTGIIAPPDVALAEGDVVEISCEPIGTLRNPCRVVRAGAAASSGLPP